MQFRGTFRAVGLLALAGLCACAGGGGGAAPSVAPAAAPAANSGVSSQALTAVGTATLTIVFSSGFHTAPLGALGKTQSGSRTPAYVNSHASDYLQVWVVNGTQATHVVNTNITATSNGVQTLSIPLYSTSANDIVAYEADIPYGQTFGSLLSVGETDFNSFTPGSAPQIALTMSMNAAYPGVMSDPDDANSDAFIAGSGPAYYTYPAVCTAGQNSGPLYFYVADFDGGFVDAAGTGGVAPPTIQSWSSDIASPLNTLTKANGVNGAYSVTFNNLGGLTVNLTAANLAYPIAGDAINSGGAYPGLDQLYKSTVDASLSSFLSNIYYGYGPNISGSIDIKPNTSGCP